jgi:WD40 repeat protein
MPLICTCPQGHRWQYTGTSTPPLCPTCGTAAANVNEDTGPDLQAETLTFPPGAHPHPAPPGTQPPMLPAQRIAEILGKLAPAPNPGAAPRAPLPPAEGHALPWLAERPRPAPPPRSPGHPALVAAGVTAGSLLALGALAWFLWLGPAVDTERERADKLAADNADQLSKFNKATQSLEAERKAHARAKEDLKAEQDRRLDAEAQAAEHLQNFDSEKSRRRDLEAALGKERARLKKALEAEARHNKELAAARGPGAGGVYPYHIALADLELRLKAPGNLERAADWLRRSPAAQRGWEWHYLNGQCDTETLTCGPLAGPALAVAYSPDGKRLAAGGADRLIHVWDALTGKELFSRRGHGGDVTSLAFSPDGRRLASGGGTEAGLPGAGEVRLWDAASGKDLQTLPAPAPVKALAFGPDGRLAAGCADGTVKRWDAAGKELPALKHAAQVHAVAFSPDGALLACGDGEIAPGRTSAGQVKVWDFQDGREVLTLKGHPGPVVGVAFAPDGKRLFSADALGNVKFWDAAARGTAEALSTRQLSPFPLGPLAAGKRLFVGSPAGTLYVMNPATGGLVRTQRTAGRIFALAATRDGDRVATAEQDKAVHVRDFSPRQPFRAFEAHAGTVTCLAFSADGGLLATAGRDCQVRLWDPRTAREVHLLGGLARPVREVAFSPDGKRLVTVGRPSDGADRAIEVALWDTATGKKIGEVPGRSGEFATAGFGPDGKRLLLAVPGKGLFIWDLEAGKAALRLDDLPGAPQAKGEVERLAVSPDGKRVALAGSAGLKVFQRTLGPAGEEWRTRVFKPAPGLNGLAWAPRGGGLLVGYRGGVMVLDTDAGKGLGRWTGPYPDPRGAALSPDGKRIFTTMGSPTVMAWHLPAPSDGRSLLSLRGVNAELTCLAFSPNGRRLAAGSTGGNLILWDAPRASAAK